MFLKLGETIMHLHAPILTRLNVYFTSTHSVEPIRPYSSAPQLQKRIERRGLHRPTEKKNGNYITMT